jgi:hypothetical protein
MVNSRLDQSKSDEESMRRSQTLVLPLALSICLTATAATSHDSPTTTVPEIKIKSGDSCLDLSEKGASTTKPDTHVVGAAIQDDADHHLAFYRNLSSPNAALRYYVFTIDGFTDIYRVYLVDEPKQTLKVKFLFGSLGYPVTETHCIYPGLGPRFKGIRK